MIWTHMCVLEESTYHHVVDHQLYNTTSCYNMLFTRSRSAWARTPIDDWSMLARSLVWSQIFCLDHIHLLWKSGSPPGPVGFCKDAKGRLKEMFWSTLARSPVLVQDLLP